MLRLMTWLRLMPHRSLMRYGIGLIAGLSAGGWIGYGLGSFLYDLELDRYFPTRRQGGEQPDMMFRNWIAWIRAGGVFGGSFLGGVLGVAVVGIRSAGRDEAGQDSRREPQPDKDC